MKRFLIIFSILVLGLSFAYVAGAQEDVQQQGGGAVTLGYPDFASAKTPADFISQLYNYLLGIVGAIAVAMIVYGGVRYVVTAGNSASQSEAKDIIKSAVLGIVLLGGAYLILNTINPDFINLKNPDLYPIQDSGGQIDSVLDPILRESATLASQLIARTDVEFSGSADCVPESDAGGVIRDVAASKAPLVCSPSCQCLPGGRTGSVSVHFFVLRTIIAALDAFDTRVRINSFTGGKHSAGSPHYMGRAADFAVLSDDPQEWNAFVDALRNNGGRAACELVVAGETTFPDCKEIFNEDGSRKPGTHIHAYW